MSHSMPIQPRRASRWPATSATVITLVFFSCLFTTACSVRKFAVNKIGDALANSGTTFASDYDPELIRDALPFSLKLVEGLLAESPRHRGLLLAAASGFTQYAYAFIHLDAEEAELRDLAAARALRDRSRRLYFRARDYALRGLELRHPGFGKALRENPERAAAQAGPTDVAFLHWAAASWAAAISISKDNPDAVADLPVVQALIDRALQLDEKYDHCALHSFLIAYEAARPGVSRTAATRSRRHFERAVELSSGRLVSPFVSLAENVCVSEQNRAEFESLPHRALAIDPGAQPEWRLVNLVMQRRARWLLAHSDELFAE